MASLLGFRGSGPGAVMAAKREVGADALRIACFVGIVLIHTNSHGGFTGYPAAGFLADELSRFAVPSFFIVSGYFWKPEAIGFPQLPLRVARRVLPPFAVWFAIYTVLGTIGFMGAEYAQRTPLQLVTALWSGGAGYHLWFLPALIVGAAIVSVAGGPKSRSGFAVVLGLYLTGVLLGTYLPALLGLSFPAALYRNGIFFAPLFLLVGTTLRAGSARGVATSWLVLAAIAGTALHLAEGWWVARSFPEGHDYSIGTAVAAIAIAALATRWRGNVGWISTLGEATFGAFLVHALVLRCVLNTSLAAWPWLLVPSVIALSLGLSLAGRAMLARTRLSFVLL